MLILFCRIMAGLDLLCDMLDENMSDEENVDDPGEVLNEMVEDPSAESQNESLQTANNDSSKAEENEDEENIVGNEDDEDPLEAQLKAMQEQMLKMQKELAEKKQKKKLQSQVGLKSLNYFFNEH